MPLHVERFETREPSLALVMTDAQSPQLPQPAERELHPDRQHPAVFPQVFEEPLLEPFPPTLRCDDHVAPGDLVEELRRVRLPQPPEDIDLGLGELHALEPPLHVGPGDEEAPRLVLREELRDLVPERVLSPQRRGRDDFALLAAKEAFPVARLVIVELVEDQDRRPAQRLPHAPEHGRRLIHVHRTVEPQLLPSRLVQRLVQGAAETLAGSAVPVGAPVLEVDREERLLLLEPRHQADHQERRLAGARLADEPDEGEVLETVQEVVDVGVASAEVLAADVEGRGSAEGGGWGEPPAGEPGEDVDGEEGEETVAEEGVGVRLVSGLLQEPDLFHEVGDGGDQADEPTDERGARHHRVACLAAALLVRLGPVRQRGSLPSGSWIRK